LRSVPRSPADTAGQATRAARMEYSDLGGLTAVVQDLGGFTPPEVLSPPPQQHHHYGTRAVGHPEEVFEGARVAWGDPDDFRVRRSGGPAAPINVGGGAASPQYLRPARSIMGRKARVPPLELSEEQMPQDGSGLRMERWRERGALRWPPHASELIMKQPSQFRRSDEIIPLQRTVPNAQATLPGEVWCRSLRTESLGLQEIGRNNQNLANTSAIELFDRSGQGWTGKANSKRPNHAKPDMTEWVDRPVAVGKMALDHMGGTRYAMGLNPRVCVPNSMAHLRGSSLPAVRGLPMSARG